MDLFKAFINLMLIFILGLVSLLAFFLVPILGGGLYYLFTKESRYVMYVLIAWDQAINAVLYGCADNTISSRVGYFASVEHKPSMYMETVIDFLFGKGHCRKEIEWDHIHKNIVPIGFS